MADQQTTDDTTATGNEIQASKKAKGAMHKVKIGAIFGIGGLEIESSSSLFVFLLVIIILSFMTSWIIYLF